VTPNGHCWE